MVQYLMHLNTLKFIYSEKTTNFCEIFTLLLSYVLAVKSKVKILQNFAAISEYMNFTENDFKNQNSNLELNLTRPLTVATVHAGCFFQYTFFFEEF